MTHFVRKNCVVGVQSRFQPFGSFIFACLSRNISEIRVDKVEANHWQDFTKLLIRLPGKMSTLHMIISRLLPDRCGHVNSSRNFNSLFYPNLLTFISSQVLPGVSERQRMHKMSLVDSEALA